MDQIGNCRDGKHAMATHGPIVNKTRNTWNVRSLLQRRQQRVNTKWCRACKKPGNPVSNQMPNEEAQIQHRLEWALSYWSEAIQQWPKFQAVSMPHEDIVEANCDPCDCNLYCNQERGASKDHHPQQPLREGPQLRHNIVVLRMMSRPVTKSWLCVAKSMWFVLTDLIENFEKHPSQYFANFVAKLKIT